MTWLGILNIIYGVINISLMIIEVLYFHDNVNIFSVLCSVIGGICLCFGVLEVRGYLKE